MVTRERRLDRARRQAQRALIVIGEEFRQARLRAGLTLAELGAAVGLSASEMSRIELGQATYVPFSRLALIAAALGLDLSLRAYPAGEPIRDVAQLALLAKLRVALPADLGWQTEVPLNSRAIAARGTQSSRVTAGAYPWRRRPASGTCRNFRAGSG